MVARERRADVLLEVRESNGTAHSYLAAPRPAELFHGSLGTGRFADVVRSALDSPGDLPPDGA